MQILQRVSAPYSDFGFLVSVFRAASSSFLRERIRPAFFLAVGFCFDLITLAIVAIAKMLKITPKLVMLGILGTQS